MLLKDSMWEESQLQLLWNSAKLSIVWVMILWSKIIAVRSKFNFKIIDRKFLYFLSLSWNQKSSTINARNFWVPQDLNLGSLHVLIYYINDIVNVSDRILFILFADDTALYSSGIKQCITFQICSHPRVTLKVNKSQVMIFCRMKRPISIPQVELREVCLCNSGKNLNCRREFV